MGRTFHVGSTGAKSCTRESFAPAPKPVIGSGGAGLPRLEREMRNAGFYCVRASQVARKFLGSAPLGREAF